ncbi:unnamed protein product [Haemonchus placei]|uniref:Transposase n=1 Tax=Haemonchus placei TaxID=6290 RepID=A0A0N4WK17_HAEPC|nr:unnamed protein product [Haemonchus placei]
MGCTRYNLKLSDTRHSLTACLACALRELRRLTVLIDVDHPPLSVHIEVLRKLNYEARAALTRLQEDQNNAKKP